MREMEREDNTFCSRMSFEAHAKKEKAVLVEEKKHRLGSFFAS